MARELPPCKGVRLLSDLADLVSAFLAPIAWHLLVTATAALVLVALVARQGCACTTKETAYAVAMRADLRNVAAYHELRRAGGVKVLDTMPRADRFRWSTGVVLVYMRPTADGFVAEVSYPGNTENRCRLVHVWRTEPAPTCYWMRRKGRRAY